MPHCLHRWGTGLGLLGGAVITAAMITLATAHADDEVTSASPIELLNSAAADLTQAYDVLNPVSAVLSRDDNIQSPQSLVDGFLPIVDKFEALQAPLLSHDDPFAGLAESLFGGLDQQFAHAADAVLTASQAISADPSIGGYGLLFAFFQFEVVEAEAILPGIGASLIDQLFGLGGADAAGIGTDLVGTTAADAAGGGADLAASFAPADLFF